MKYLSRDEEIRLVKSLMEVDLFESVVVLFLLHTGLRIGEAQKVLAKDVFDKDEFYPTTLKRRTDSRRYMPISRPLKSILKAYQVKWNENLNPALNPEGRLFYSSRTFRPYTIRGLQRLVERALERAECSHFNCHSLRHTFAIRLVWKGVNLEYIQHLLGHASLGSTGKYIIPTEEELKRVMNEFG